MLSPDDLKDWLSQEHPPSTKLLLILATFDEPCPIKAIVDRAEHCGWRIKQRTNVSMVMSRMSGLAIRTGTGWEITSTGRDRLRQMGIDGVSASVRAVASDLRLLLPKISDSHDRSFAQEAVGCFEARFYRAAVIMSWLAAINVLQKYVASKHLREFNVEASRVDARWKAAKTADDLGKMKEGDFLDRVSSISLIGKNVKERLKARLDLRNACGHPNSLRLSHNTVASHIEILLLNVLTLF